MRTVRLDDEMRRFAQGIVCLVGGGGKTTLLHALGKALAAEGQRVLCTTTTKMAEPGPEVGMPVELADDPDSLRLPREGLLLAARPGPGGKVQGYSPEELDRLDERGFADWILVEADGAARRPLKAPAPYEPVVPSRTRASVAVVGLTALAQPFSPEQAFRFDLVAALTGLKEGDAVTPEAVAILATHPNGLFQYTPAGAARLLLCNQADLPGAAARGVAIAAVLAERHPGALDGIYVGSLQTEGLRCRAFPTE